MKSIYLLLVCWSVTLSFVFANGDPVATLSSLTKSANPSPNPIADIEIVKEELYIQPSKNTTVRVKYVLHNSSTKDYNNIDYGFPVDYTGAGMINAPLSGDLISESEYSVGWHDYYIKQLTFSVNGNDLPYTMSEETVINRADRKALKNEYEVFFEEGQALSDQKIEQMALEADLVRRWFYTKFSIKAGQTCELEVEYTLRNYFTTPLYSLNSFIQNGRGAFYYDMSPAQHWGNGRAKELFVEIDFSLATDFNDKIYKEYSLNPVSGLPFTQVDNKMIYKAKDFDFKDSKPIELEYFANWTIDYKDLLQHRISASGYKITALQEVAAYPLSNLSDLNLSTAWVIKTNSEEDAKLKIIFAKPTVIGAIVVVGGYHKSADTYRNNAQPKTISIDFGDDNGEQYLYTWNQNFDEQIIGYVSISDKNVLDYSMIYTPFMFSNPYYNPVKEITLNIKDVYPGAKFDDLCISEIIILSPDFAPRLSTSSWG